MSICRMKPKIWIWGQDTQPPGCDVVICPWFHNFYRAVALGADMTVSWGKKGPELSETEE